MQFVIPRKTKSLAGVVDPNNSFDLEQVPRSAYCAKDNKRTGEIEEMNYAIVTDPNRPHYSECGPVEWYHCFYTIRWGPEPSSLVAYFPEEVLVFSLNLPAITA
jgi:hypothetical protein